MDLSEHFRAGGSGVIATASRGGVVNTAVYAVPRIVGPELVAWGMTEGRTHENLLENPNASFLYMDPGDARRGVRLTLSLERIDGAGGLLDEIRARASEAVGPAAGNAVRYVATFRVIECRRL